MTDKNDAAFRALERRVSRLERLLGIHNGDATHHVYAPLTRIMAIVAASYGLDIDVLISRRRDRRADTARFAAVWIGRRITEQPLAEIGRALGGRDYSTVTHALKRAAALRDQDGAFKAMCDRIVAQLKAEDDQ